MMNTVTVLMREGGHRPTPGRRRGLRLVARSRSIIVGLVIVTVFILAALFAPLVAPYDPLEQDLVNRSRPPSAAHLLGTDRLGRDMLSRIVYGSRLSLSVSLGAVLFGAIWGIAVGLTAGYFRGIVDGVLMRIVDILLAFPMYLLAILVMAVLGSSVVNTSLAIGVAVLPRFARLVRGEVLAHREAAYVEAARAIGASDVRIMVLHILPNILNAVIVTMSLLIGSAILVEASLSFLGVGLPPPTPAWGLMVSDGLAAIRSTPWVSFFPGLTITLAVLGFNLLGDGLRDLLDPRLRDLR